MQYYLSLLRSDNLLDISLNKCISSSCFDIILFAFFSIAIANKTTTPKIISKEPKPIKSPLPNCTTTKIRGIPHAYQTKTHQYPKKKKAKPLQLNKVLL
ncbi:hypothetical protein [Ammoniphilus sp. YIM 78166]|uniref:hypothetical protein n=1 Tax=Ammoniphilus sp. YIM 78166 TaxID=1644106 RepID=UPI00142FA1E2|nr:hypothetical protein [Ammoniphilus sp. YIM 78166]